MSTLLYIDTLPEIRAALTGVAAALTPVQINPNDGDYARTLKRTPPETLEWLQSCGIRNYAQLLELVGGLTVENIGNLRNACMDQGLIARDDVPTADPNFRWPAAMPRAVAPQGTKTTKRKTRR